jgi:hydroxyacylglutathione hydrolase
MEQLEDDFTWVLRKTLKGLDLAPALAAERAGLPENEVMAFSRGRFSAETARRLAPALGLDPDALAAHDRYLPRPLEISGIKRLNLPFNGETVNAWLITSADASVLFDTGNDPGSCAAALGETRPNQVFITHGHNDHIGGVCDLAAMDIPVHGPAIDRALPVAPGEIFHCGSLTLRACDLSGHFSPSVGYHVEGLTRPVLITGDALFAGSMGGCATPPLYQHALRRLAAVLDPLPDETILLPGHGPATTLGEERLGNPFLVSLRP